MRANRRYVGKRYPGRITLFWSAEWNTFAADVFQPGWKQLSAEGVESCPAGGTHDAMLREPYVQTLAAQLRTRLEAVA